MLRTLSITALPAALAGAALFLLLTWLAGGSGSSEVASPEARAHVEAPTEVACGQSFTLDVYADDIPAREGQPPGLATFDVWVSHPVNAFSVEAGKLTVNDALSTLPTVDGRQRQWLYAGDWFDPPTGTFTWGAFSYIGEPPADGRIDSVTVTAVEYENYVGGLRVSEEHEPVFLGSATLVALQEGKHRIQVKLWFTDPSITYYPEVVMERDVTVGGGDCPDVTPVPTATVTITPMPVYTPNPNFTPNPFPDLVTPEPELYELPDVCGGEIWESKLLSARMCVADGWTLTVVEPDPSEVAPEDKRPSYYNLSVLFERPLAGGGKALLELSVFNSSDGGGFIHISACAEPARIDGMPVCVHDVGNQLGATRHIGVRVLDTWATITIQSEGETLANPHSTEAIAAQREALAMLASLERQ